MNIKNYCEQIISGDLAKQMLESHLEDYFWGEDRDFKLGDPLILEIFSDYYDNSIEVNFSYMTKEGVQKFFDEKITKEFISELLVAGCSCFWLNFYLTDNTEDSLRKKIAEIACAANYKNLNFF